MARYYTVGRGINPLLQPPLLPSPDAFRRNRYLRLSFLRPNLIDALLRVRLRPQKFLKYGLKFSEKHNLPKLPSSSV